MKITIMNKKVVLALIALAVLLIWGVALLSLDKSAGPATITPITQRQAIDAVITKYPDLAKYETTSLPPSFVEAKVAEDGWNVGFIQRGSGLPGILNAACYHVGNDRSVSTSGEFKYNASEIVEAIALDTCKAVPNPSAVTKGKCYVGGCSAQICSDRPDQASDCMYRPEYACYKSATCERQSDGKCGWTQSASLTACLKGSV